MRPVSGAILRSPTDSSGTDPRTAPRAQARHPLIGVSANRGYVRTGQVTFLKAVGTVVRETDAVAGREPPSPHFGDPDGAHWFAFPPSRAEQQDEETFEVCGVIRFRMPEDEVDLPLWDDGGLLPEESELLEVGLGLSAALIADVKAWGVAWNASRRAAGRGEAWEPRRDRLVAEAVVLVDRMRAESKGGLQVELDFR